jgi:aminopeptidase N
VVTELTGKRRPDLLLVNDDDLAYAKVRLDDRSVRTLEESLGSLDGGVARAVVWGSLWDATRDAELAARRFVELVASHGPVEPDISVLQTLLQQASSCADRYGDPANRQALRQRLAEVAREQLDQTEPGSDRQLVWVRVLLSSRTDQGFAAGLLSGDVVVPELSVSPDLRWFALAHLAVMGGADEAMIQAEFDRDPTDVGGRGAETARAARPLAEAKATAWDRALDFSLALHTRRAIMQGFFQPEQDALLAEYTAQRWVDALPIVWETVDSEEALTMTRLLYPQSVVSDSVVKASDRALGLDLPPVAKRSLGESRDSTLRAIRGRKADHA